MLAERLRSKLNEHVANTSANATPAAIVAAAAMTPRGGYPMPAPLMAASVQQPGVRTVGKPAPLGGVVQVATPMAWASGSAIQARSSGFPGSPRADRPQVLTNYPAMISPRPQRNTSRAATSQDFRRNLSDVYVPVDSSRCAETWGSQRPLSRAAVDGEEVPSTAGNRRRNPSAPPQLCPVVARQVSAPELGIAQKLSPRGDCVGDLALCALSADKTRVSQGTLSALEGATLKAERQKLLRAQDKQQNWLKKALSARANDVKRAADAVERASAQEAHMQAVTRRLEEELMFNLQSKKEARELRENAVMENNIILDKRRQQEIDEYLRRERYREERIMTLRSQKLEELTDRAATEAVRHMEIYNEAHRLEEEKRDVHSEHVKTKEDKVRTLLNERQRLWKMRRGLVHEGAQVWRSLKYQLERRRAKSLDPEDCLGGNMRFEGLSPRKR